MEPHTSQFKVLLKNHEYCVFDTVSKTSSKHNYYSSNKNLENLKVCNLNLEKLGFKLKKTSVAKFFKLTYK